jgi:hypothetical protein
MAPPPPDAGHQFERDLREIREARGVSLSEVQQETRIPLDVLDRFESGHLVGDRHYNEVYLRNLLKAYGAAIGLPPSAVVEQFEAAKAGTYSGQLREHLGEGAAKAKQTAAPQPPAPDAAADDNAESEEAERPASRQEEAPPERLTPFEVIIRTPDGLPLIGRTTSPRVYTAGGHGMWGITHGPVTGHREHMATTERRIRP